MKKLLLSFVLLMPTLAAAQSFPIDINQVIPNQGAFPALPSDMPWSQQGQPGPDAVDSNAASYDSTERPGYYQNRLDTEFAASLQSLGMACGTSFTGNARLDGASRQTLKQIGHAIGYCDQLVSAIRELCDTHSGAIGKKIKRLSCKCGRAYSFSLSGGTASFTFNENMNDQTYDMIDRLRESL